MVGLSKRHKSAFHRNTSLEGTALDASEREKLLKPFLPPLEPDSESSDNKPNANASPTSTTSSSNHFTSSTMTSPDAGARSRKPLQSPLSPPREDVDASADMAPGASRSKSRRRRRPRFRPMLKQQVQLFVFLTIQAVFGLWVRMRRAFRAVISRILSVMYYHHRTPDLIRNDVRHLDKLPKHLSVIVTLGCGIDDGGKGNATSAGLEGLMADVAEIAAWCASVGIPTLSVYERTGILKRYIPETYNAIHHTLRSYFGHNTPSPTLRVRSPNQPAYSPPTTPPTARSDSNSNSNSNSNSDDTPSPPAQPGASSESDFLAGAGASAAAARGPGPAGPEADKRRLEVLLLGADDGRSTLVDLTKTLAEMAQQGTITPADVTAELVDVEIKGCVMDEPDMLIVFGPRVVLDGYPPWQVRLAEIFHVPDNSEGVGYQVFLRALHRYAKAQMRFGR